MSTHDADLPGSSGEVNNVVEGPWEPATASQGSANASPSESRRQWRMAFFHPKEVWSEAVQQIGKRVVQAGHNIESGSRTLRSAVPAMADLIPIAQQVRETGESILRTPLGMVEVAEHLGENLLELGQEGRKVMDSVASRDLTGAMRGARDLVGKGVGTLVDYSSALAGVVVEKVDFNRQIDQLNEGDRYTIALGGDLQTEKLSPLGLQGFADGQIRVWRRRGQYIVAVDGQLAAGVHPNAETGLGLTLKAEWEAKAGAGVSLEMTFDTADEARRATRSLLQMSVIAGASMASGLGGLVSFPMGMVLSPSEEDVQAMRERISAVEVSGMMAAQLAGSIGVGTGTVDLLGLFGDVDAGSELAARIEVFSDKAPVVVLRQSVLLGGSLYTKAGISISEGTGRGRQMINPEQIDASMSLGPGGIDLSAGLGGAVQGKLSAESRVQLPTSLPIRDLVRSPVESIKGITSEMLTAEPSRLSLLLRSGGLFLTKKSGMETSLTFYGSLLPLIQSGAIHHALSGELVQALRAAGDQVRLEASVRPYQVTGHTLQPSVKIGGIGVGLQGGLTGVDYDTPLWEFSGDATSITENLESKLHSVIQLLKERSSTTAKEEPSEESNSDG